MAASVAELRDREVLAALAQVTEDLGVGIEDPAPIADTAEARAALAALLQKTGRRPDAAADDIVADEDAAPAVGREMLSILLADNASRDAAAEAVESPPADDQLSIELAIASAVVLGALITWLQTKIHIKVKREAGQTSFEFELTKDATDPETIEKVASTVGSLI